MAQPLGNQIKRQGQIIKQVHRAVALKATEQGLARSEFVPYPKE